MNDSELNELLRRARVPERSAEDWKELTGDTMRRLRFSLSPIGGEGQGEGAPRFVASGHEIASVGRRKFFALFAAGLATACVLIGFFVGHWHRGQDVTRDEIAAARKLFSELNAMFPNQLEAVVLDGSAPRLVLAEKKSLNRGTPIFVRLCGANGCQRVITFSGRRVPLNGEMCEVLLDARGQVIVTGERFAWSSGDATAASGGYRIEAAALAGVL